MPAAFELDSNEFVISRYSRAHPKVEFLGRVRNRSGVLHFEMRAPGALEALQGLKRGLEAKYEDVTIRGENAPTMEYDLPVAALQGILGPVLTDLAGKSEVVFLRIHKGAFMFWFPDLAKSMVQTTLNGRLGMAAAPAVSEQEPSYVASWT